MCSLRKRCKVMRRRRRCVRRGMMMRYCAGTVACGYCKAGHPIPGRKKMKPISGTACPSRNAEPSFTQDDSMVFTRVRAHLYHLFMGAGDADSDLHGKIE